MVLYFTGTGNSKYIAERIATALNEDILSMNDRIKEGNTANVMTGKSMVIVVPTYAWRIPRVVLNWLQQIKFPEAKQIWFVMDCGGEIGNAAKYAMPHTRVYVKIAAEDGDAVFQMKNVSANELTFNPEEITERFVRGDSSRNTEGSGLGLAIVKSFVEIQKGKFWIETEADLFKAEIRWKLVDKKDDIA